MAQPETSPDRRMSSWVESPTRPGNSAREVVVGNDEPIDVTGEFDAAPSGLRNAGRHSKITVNDSSWTALPSTPLTDRNAMAIQNNSTTSNVKLNYDNGVAGYEGMTIRKNGGERQYDIKETIIVYAKSESGSVDLDIEELS